MEQVWKLGDPIGYFTVLAQGSDNGNLDQGDSREEEMNTLKVYFEGKIKYSWYNELDVVYKE